MNSESPKKLSISPRRGAATLVTVLVIAAIVLIIAISGVFVATVLTNTAFNERLASEALLAARAGAQDAIIRVVRYRDCPGAGCPASYSIDIDGAGTREAEIEIIDFGSIGDCTAGSGVLCVSSVGIANLRQKRILVELGVDDITGEVRVQSFKEIAL